MNEKMAATLVSSESSRDGSIDTTRSNIHSAVNGAERKPTSQRTKWVPVIAPSPIVVDPPPEIETWVPRDSEILSTAAPAYANNLAVLSNPAKNPAKLPLKTFDF